MKVSVRSNTDAIVKGLTAKVTRSHEALGYVAGQTLEMTARRIAEKGFVAKGARIPSKDVYFGRKKKPYSKTQPVERSGNTRREFDVISGAQRKAAYELHIGDGTIRAEVSRVSGKVRAIFRSNSAKLATLENVQAKAPGSAKSGRRFINKQWAYVTKSFRKSLEKFYGPSVGAK